MMENENEDDELIEFAVRSMCQSVDDGSDYFFDWAVMDIFYFDLDKLVKTI